MKGSRQSGIGGLLLSFGTGLLFFALEAAGVEVPVPILWTLGVVAVGLILYGIVGWQIDRSVKDPRSPGDVTSLDSSGHTVGIITAGRDVVLSTPPGSNPQQNRYLALDIEELEPRRIPSRNNDWRVTVCVKNTGRTADVSAYLLAPIGGLAEPDYGHINVQWESVRTNFSTLVTHKPEKLHIARISDRRTVRFLSPGQFGGESREYQQKQIRITDSPIRGVLMFNTTEGGCVRRSLEIHLGHDNKPTIHIGQPEPCQDAADS